MLLEALCMMCVPLFLSPPAQSSPHSVHSDFVISHVKSRALGSQS